MNTRTYYGPLTHYPRFHFALVINCPLHVTTVLVNSRTMAPPMDRWCCSGGVFKLSEVGVALPCSGGVTNGSKVALVVSPMVLKLQWWCIKWL